VSRMRSRVVCPRRRSRSLSRRADVRPPNSVIVAFGSSCEEPSFPNCSKWHRENAAGASFHHQLVSASDLYARISVLVTTRVIFGAGQHDLLNTFFSAAIETGNWP
jgi:hypothetical protein